MGPLGLLYSDDSVFGLHQDGLVSNFFLWNT